ncbi:integral membrane protein [Homoserinimonas aerilata]|uniref:Integral membrane protein n=1 Tax=Homoserinimonas aerilata TaxID=1162970 RepID=A0A542YFN7_9MICO|nr:DUF3817 domain-containing protein [Homoserinimonas aerilata]TQL46784.1 integral membrane protein [Homoserinimonas aerilata]
MTTTSPPTTRLTPQRFYRVVAIAEAITWTLLIAGLLMKYVFDAGDLGVRIGGSIHGFVFLLYAATAVLVGVNQRWSIRLIVVGVLTAIVPYATIPFDLWLDRRGLLAGRWRTEKTDDPRDAHWIDRLMRWFLKHPLVLVAFVVVVVAVIFTVLVTLGPPGGR